MNARIAMTLISVLLAAPAFAQTRGLLKLPEMAGLAEKASESVAVTLDQNLLGLGCRFLDAGQPDEAAAKKVCQSLTGIYVRKFTFDSDYAYPKADIDGIRRQLAAPGWSRIVGARSRKDQTDVDVYLLVDGGKARGLAVIASEPREIAEVNIVGSIDLEPLNDLEGKYGVPELQIEDGGKAPAPAPASPQKGAPGARTP
jgi:hypothetical protein